MVNKPPVQRGRGFTAEAIENIRKRYVETDEAVYCIASDVGVHRDTIARLAADQGWPLRKQRPPRELPAALRLDLAAAQMRLTVDAGAANGGGEADVRPSDASPQADVAPLAQRLEQAVERELTKVERLKEETGSETRRTVAAERIARTLSVLTQTLFKVRALREPGAASPHEYDDLPDGADEFRRELARRIDAFVASRADTGLAEPDESSSATSPAA
jgi:hypothetical protein